MQLLMRVSLSIHLQYFFQKNNKNIVQGGLRQKGEAKYVWRVQRALSPSFFTRLKVIFSVAIPAIIVVQFAVGECIAFRCFV